MHKIQGEEIVKITYSEKAKRKREQIKFPEAVIENLAKQISKYY